jgi:hypothetical protein
MPKHGGSWDKERRVVARIEASASHADDMLP